MHKISSAMFEEVIFKADINLMRYIIFEKEDTRMDLFYYRSLYNETFHRALLQFVYKNTQYFELGGGFKIKKSCIKSEHSKLMKSRINNIYYWINEYTYLCNFSIREKIILNSHLFVNKFYNKKKSFIDNLLILQDKIVRNVKNKYYSGNIVLYSDKRFLVFYLPSKFFLTMINKLSKKVVFRKKISFNHDLARQVVNYLMKRTFSCFKEKSEKNQYLEDIIFITTIFNTKIKRFSIKKRKFLLEIK